MASSWIRLASYPIVFSCRSSGQFSAYDDGIFGVDTSTTHFYSQKVYKETNTHYGGFLPSRPHLAESPNESFWRREDKFGAGDDSLFGASDYCDKSCVFVRTDE